MAYTKQNWIDGAAGDTPIDAESLNHVEDGLEAAASIADSAAATASSGSDAAVAAQGSADDAQGTADGGVATANAAIPKATATAKGDLIVATAPGVLTRQPIGTDERTLEADSAKATGVKWGRKFTAATVAPLSPAIGDIWLDIS